MLRLHHETGGGVRRSKSSGRDRETDERRLRLRGFDRRLFAVLAVVMVLAGVLVTGRFVTVRLQDRAGPTVDRTRDATADVHAAVRRTRAQLSTLSVTSVQRVWLISPRQTTTDMNALVERAEPAAVTRLVVADDGDWSTESTRASMPFADVPLTVRHVAGEWYERGFTTDHWQHVVAEDDRSPMDVVGDDATAFDVGLIVDAATIVDHLERYDGTWTATADPDGQTHYEVTDRNAAAALAAGLGGDAASGGDRTEAADAAQDATVRVWIDDGTGLVRRIVSQTHAKMPTPSAEGIVQRDTRLQVGGRSVIEVPQRATDITLDGWCAQYTLTCAPGPEGS
jgi:hypothetical protein